MKNQRSLRATQPSHPVESTVFPGQIEQVVSSADCRSVEPLSAPDPSIFSIRGRIREDGAAGSTPADRESAEPLLTLEDRLLVAFAARGDERIGQIIVNALALEGRHIHDLYGLPDDALGRAVEEYVFYGDDSLVPSGRPVPTRASSAAADANHKASPSPSEPLL